ncbi:tRNA-intron lyase [Salinarchaeum sp. IM2453]|uniref:tRNA-intron lyase n=1 Tax=Salinarchaeum sp. IM2453 TaxID=2862870 RepID=UPI001C834C25|nr:tRNA-intron lyase [Salinarchaeum sp. IM2453]QZA89685.1 tRNA-intron lyase [Salinarchaeum sp. IM2453]
MDVYLQDGTVIATGNARQQFYDARGYGHPVEGNAIELTPVEAAHLLLRGDISAIHDEGTAHDLASFIKMVENAKFAARLAVYIDLRSRGFYLSPARDKWVEEFHSKADFVVYKRGKGPEDRDAVAYQLRVLGERETIDIAELGEYELAVADEEGEITYFKTDIPEITGTVTTDFDGTATGQLLSDRVICWEYPKSLYDPAFYGQPLIDRGETTAGLQLSIIEAAQLVAQGILSLPGGYEQIVDRGRSVEGERFDRRLQIYASLREQGVAPKTGFKFGADFRTYSQVESVNDLGHSERLIRVVPTDYAILPRDLSLDVRMAHGVRKDMVYAWVENDSVSFRVLKRLTP